MISICAAMALVGLHALQIEFDPVYSQSYMTRISGQSLTLSEIDFRVHTLSISELVSIKFSSIHVHEKDCNSRISSQDPTFSITLSNDNVET